MVNKSEQQQKINALFGDQNRLNNNEIKVIETKPDLNCDVHSTRRRTSSGGGASLYSSRKNLSQLAAVTTTAAAPDSHRPKKNTLTTRSTTNLNGGSNGYGLGNSVVYRKKKLATTTSDLSPRTASIISSFGFDQEENRRQSYTEGDKARKRNSWNSSVYRPLEHPSAFPSLLRSTETLNHTSQTNSNHLKRATSVSVNRNGYESPSSTYYSNSNKSPSTMLNRSGTASSTTNLSRRTMSTSMSALNTTSSINGHNKFTTTRSPLSVANGNNVGYSQNLSSNSTLRRQKFGGSQNQMYLRTDSMGQLNLVKRDNLAGSTSRLSNGSLYGSRTRLNSISSNRSSVPREVTMNGVPTTKMLNEKASILRKSPSIEHLNGSAIQDLNTKLTKDNLKRHVRILEANDKDECDGGGTTGVSLNNLNATSNRRRGSSVSAETLDDLSSRRISIDSLEVRKNSIDSQKGIPEEDLANLNLNGEGEEDENKNEAGRPHFVAVTSLEDVQAVRCAEFHPSGRIYAVGSNSKTFRICEYPTLADVREDHTTYQPTVLFKRTKHHKGSIYCMGWAPDGELVATGSNDKTIKLMRYNDVNKQLEGRETELTMHDGTVRDLCFLEDTTNKASLLISGGAGDCKIYVTDCATATPFQALSGHGGHILSLYNWGGAMFCSGSQDKTIRFWDLRTRGCVNTITPATNPGSRQGSPVAGVCVDPSGRLLVSGHEDSSCVLYDIRGNRPIQCFKPHSADIRSIRFSPSAYYLLTSGYDNKLVLTDLQGDLTLPLPSVVVAQHTDKVISGRWHPTDFSFLSTSADKTATLWALPPS